MHDSAPDASLLSPDLYKKFRDQHREYSPHIARPFYGYLTTVIVSVPCWYGVARILNADLSLSRAQDTKAMASTLTSGKLARRVVRIDANVPPFISQQFGMACSAIISRRPTSYSARFPLLSTDLHRRGPGSHRTVSFPNLSPCIYSEAICFHGLGCNLLYCLCTCACLASSGPTYGFSAALALAVVYLRIYHSMPLLVRALRLGSRATRLTSAIRRASEFSRSRRRPR